MPAPAAITPFAIIDVVSGFVLRNLPAKVTTLSSTTPKPNHAAVVFKLAFTGLILATGLAFRPSIVFWSFFCSESIQGICFKCYWGYHYYFSYLVKICHSKDYTTRKNFVL